MKDVVVDEVMLQDVWEYVVQCRAYTTINRRGIAYTTINKEKFEYFHEREEEYAT